MTNIATQTEPRRRVPIEVDSVVSLIKQLSQTVPEIDRIELRVSGSSISGISRFFERNGEGNFEPTEKG